MARICFWLAAAITSGAVAGTVAAFISAAESVRF